MNELISKISKGIFVILPFLLLFWIFSFVYDFCAAIFYSIFGITNANLAITLLIFAISLALLYYIGHLVDKNKEFLLIRVTEIIIGKIPVVKSIYSGIKEVLNIFSGKNKEGYLGVAYVDMGNMELMGFITKEDGDHYWVFVPTTPNPTSGFILRIHKDNIRISDLSVSDGFKKIISLGVK
ncbi:DUF502 domain-containing protein [Helicobacter canadensis]|uniref:DUF502 domain-containing protein n=1 Tax=Helicobacter canadensis MIT 98-5491 TaxID=537970 RepID=C5ZYG4_9HELI|nr:DUF502 domain-containing protein [Helicobacter canadensis]EES90182.1 conserved hypothetical protein [Helicobacter canadensis MIT 98-5491]EFR49339.1 hypothetical protein HCMG_01513 [Helicobacter canadensis MIT 98-5491]STP02312.1 Uncharacterized conserved protein [Helicobacter canadensis]